MHLPFYLPVGFGLAFKFAVIAHTEEMCSCLKTNCG